MTGASDREPYLDNAKLAMIFFVVFGHLLEPLVTSQRSHPALTLYLLIYLFHVPAWVFFAGITSRVRGCLKSCLSLLAILVFFQVFYVALIPNLRHQAGQWIFTPWWILWFLLSLTFWKLLLPVAIKVRWPIFASVTIALAVGFISPIGRPLSLSRTFVWFPFFLTGHLYGKRILEKARSTSLLIRCLCATSLVIAAYGLWIAPFNYEFLYEAESYSMTGFHSQSAGVLFRLGHLLVAALLSASTLCLIPPHSGFLTKYGARTLAMLTVHPLLVRLFWLGSNRARISASPLLLVVPAVALVWFTGALPLHQFISLLKALPESVFRIRMTRRSEAILPR